MITRRFYPLRDLPQYGVLGQKGEKPRAAQFVSHTGWAKAKPIDIDISAPASDGATWPCGHPKTQANTASVGSAGFRCRMCRRAINRKCASKIRGAA